MRTDLILVEVVAVLHGAVHDLGVRLAHVYILAAVVGKVRLVGRTAESRINRAVVPASSQAIAAI